MTQATQEAFEVHFADLGTFTICHALDISIAPFAMSGFDTAKQRVIYLLRQFVE